MPLYLNGSDKSQVTKRSRGQDYHTAQIWNAEARTWWRNFFALKALLQDVQVQLQENCCWLRFDGADDGWWQSPFSLSLSWFPLLGSYHAHSLPARRWRNLGGEKCGRYAQIRSCKVETESQAENSHGSILLGAAHWVHIWPPTINKSTPSQIQCLILGIQGSVLNDTILSKLVHIIRMLNKGLAVYILNIQLYPSVGPPEALQPAT